MITPMTSAAKITSVGGSITDLQALARLRRQAPVAVHAAIAAVLLVGVGTVVTFQASSAMEPWERLAFLGLGLAGGTCAALGALILASVPRHGVGLALLVGGALCALWMVASAWAEGAAPPYDSGREWAVWVENWAFVGLIVLMTWPLLLFPDGRLPSRRWRPVGALLLAGTAAIWLLGVLDPGTLDAVEGIEGVANPLGIPESWDWIEALGVFGFGVPVGVVAALIAIHRRASARPEPGMRGALWAARALVGNIAIWLILAAVDPDLTDGPLYAATFTIAIAAFALAASVAVLRHRTVEVDQLLRRAFIVVGVTALSLTVFAIVFAAIGALAGDTFGSLGGGLAVALAAVPLQVRVRSRVDSQLYGHRDPSVAVARLSEELGAAGDPAEALPGLARAVGDTLHASGVLLEPDPKLGLAPVRVGGELQDPVLERSLSHRGQPVGRMALGARAPGEDYAPADLVLVELLTRQIALAVHAIALAVQLQESRGEIVIAREEERRRLRRDLHDGLGPALAGIALTLEAAQNSGGTVGDELVKGAREQTQAVVTDVRRIVHGLRPPVLDDLGLAAALRAHADRLAPLQVEIELAALSPPLSAAAELAVYRIATEALTNVVRHADARTCRVALHGHSDEIVLAVTDDGRGLDPNFDPGVGVRSMRERAAELGGRVELHRATPSGLALVVHLPRGRPQDP